MSFTANTMHLTVIYGHRYRLYRYSFITYIKFTFLGKQTKTIAFYLFIFCSFSHELAQIECVPLHKGHLTFLYLLFKTRFFIHACHTCLFNIFILTFDNISQE